MNKILKNTIIALFLITSYTTVHAQAPNWKIDPAHSGIYFSINHIYSKVNGYFGDFKGRIDFDPNNLGKSVFEFTVKVKSINTNNTKRDNHLLSNDFFSAKKYPEMRFKSASIKHAGQNQYEVEGTMTIKDVSRKIKVPFTFFGSKTHPFDPKQEVAGFEALMTIDRLVFNVGSGKFLKLGVVGRETNVMITIEATRAK